MEDEKIISLYKERSESAISETDKKYGARCRATAYNILQSREDSEECANDTYLRLWNAIPPAEPSPLAAFIYRIVRNIALDRVKLLHRKRRAGENYTDVYNEISDCIPSGENVAKSVEDKELTALIDRFLDTLSREKRTMFLMRYWNFCTVADIAKRLGISESKVKVTLMRTREKLREYLVKEGVEV